MRLKGNLFCLLSYATLIIIMFFPAVSSMAADTYLVYFGTYTRPGQSKGIYVSRFDAVKGRLENPELAAEAVNPSFLAIHPSRHFLYAVGDTVAINGKKTGAVSAFSIDQATGKLVLLNRQSTGGIGPCHVSLDHAGRCALVANYGDGSCASLPVKADGTLGEAGSVVRHHGASINAKRQEGPHAHSINPSPDNRFALAADLGLDKIMVYRLDSAKAALAPNDPPFAAVPPGSGPRHLAFHPGGKFAYVINEMLCTVTAFRYDAAAGALEPVQTSSTLPAGTAVLPAFSTAESQVHPNGKFLYGSNRGHDTIAIFAIDEQSGLLKLIMNEPSGGETPRNFSLDPTGRWLLAANEKSGNVAVFAVEPDAGSLKATGQSVAISSPVCVKFLRSHNP